MDRNPGESIVRESPAGSKSTYPCDGQRRYCAFSNSRRSAPDRRPCCPSNRDGEADRDVANRPGCSMTVAQRKARREQTAETNEDGNDCMPIDRYGGAASAKNIRQCENSVGGDSSLFQTGIPRNRFRSLTSCAHGHAVSQNISTFGTNGVGSSKVPTSPTTLSGSLSPPFITPELQFGQNCR